MTSKSPEDFYRTVTAASAEVIPTLPKLKWARPNLWRRIVYLFNAPPYLTIELSESWHPLD